MHMTQSKAAKTPPEIVEERPPKRPNRKHDWDYFADEARARPNRWIRVFERDSTGFFMAIRAGDNPTLAAEKGFEVKSANNTKGRPHSHPDGFEQRTCSLYLRYVPANDQTKRRKRTTTKSKEA